MDLHSGIENEQGQEQVLKQHFVNGLNPKGKGKVSPHCVGWESKPLEELKSHAINYMRILAQKKKMHTEVDR